MKSIYDQSFYDQQMYRSKEAADLMLGYLFDHIGVPESMIDIGCGAGGYLQAAETHGVAQLRGVEGEWISRISTLVPQELIMKVDLATETGLRTISNSGRYELAICLEVAEHLPSSSAKSLISTMSALADIVLFGAAIPGQGGRNHINEQYQSYWVNLFKDEGFDAFDIIRPHFWNCERISEDKRQNPILFIRKTADAHRQLLNSDRRDLMADIVHPIVFDRVLKQLNELRSSPSGLIKNLIKCILGKKFVSGYRGIRRKI